MPSRRVVDDTSLSSRRAGDQPPAGNDCDIGLLHPMGTWSDGVAATRAVTYVPPP